MAKISQIEKAIENIDQQIKVLQLARQHLVEQQKAKPARKPSKPQAVQSTERSA